VASRRGIIEAFIPNSPHAAHLGIRVVSLGADEAVLELPFKPELATIGEVLHGGAIGALIDTAAMAAAWATDEVPESVAGSTVSLSVNFASAASGVDLRAEGRVARRGGRLSFCEVSVSDRRAPSWPTGSPRTGLGKNPRLTNRGGEHVGNA
jgi:uncharacterized protein (TIGR00369 family)